MMKFIFIFLFVFVVLTQVYSNTYVGKINFVIAQLESKYDVSFVYDSIPEATWKGVGYDTVSEPYYNELLSFLRIFQKEFNKYQTEFIKKSNIKYVAFVRKLNFDGQHRSSLPDAPNEILFYDILTGRNKELYTGKRSRYYLCHSIHHEIYHMIEEEINGSMYYRDSIWASFNTEGFTYGKGGASMYPDMTKKYKRKWFVIKPYETSHPARGIISTYSATALEEDKCEIFTSFFIKKERRKVRKIIATDDIVKKKIIYMKNFIVSLCPEMNDSYFYELK